VIEMGAATEVEQKEKKLRIEDAILATRAVEDGIVAGGGVVLLNAEPALKEGLGLSGDQLTGVRIVQGAPSEPMRQICANAGEEEGVVLAHGRGLPSGHGYDAVTGRYVDMFRAGIVDPAKVTRSALQNAASVAAMVLTAEAIVAEVPEMEETASGVA
jgi:chaperonin GroEL